MKVFISTSSFGEYDAEPVEMLKRVGLEPVLNTLRRTLKTEEILDYANGCIGIIAGTEYYNKELLSCLPHLRVISRCGAGLDTIDLEAARERGVTVLCTLDAPTQAVAELTVGLILNLIRNIHTSGLDLKRGVWKKRMGFLLSELTIGVIGLGRIGRRVAELVGSFNGMIIGNDLYPDDVWATAHHVAIKDRDSVIRESDVLCLHLPYQRELHHLMGKRELALMKTGSYLLNTSRGGLIDEDALYLALKSNHLKGAAIDTFEREPYNGPLKDLNNVILTPHVGSYARAARVLMELESVEHLITALKQRERVHDGAK